MASAHDLCMTGHDSYTRNFSASYGDLRFEKIVASLAQERKIVESGVSTEQGEKGMAVGRESFVPI
jgi:hypothetical protein